MADTIQKLRDRIAKLDDEADQIERQYQKRKAANNDERVKVTNMIMELSDLGVQSDNIHRENRVQ